MVNTIVTEEMISFKELGKQAMTFRSFSNFV